LISIYEPVSRKLEVLKRAGNSYCLENRVKMAQVNGEKPLSAVQKLRVMISDPEKFVVCPGVYDGYTARIALAEGAECLYMVRYPLSRHHERFAIPE
jgi:hypothetical protein